jgi:Uma2 family endonuclease
MTHVTMRTGQAVPGQLPLGRPFTRADLDALPDDGLRHELIDGVLVVSPSPVHTHQRAVVRLTIALEAACPDDLEVLCAPFDVALADDTVMIPDVIAARRSDFTLKDLPTAPVLAVEVLSPSTRRFDLMVKRSRFEAAGCASFWIVDPDEPRLVAWDLHDDIYVEVANVVGEEVFDGTNPYPIAIRPADLVAERRRS